MSYKPKFSSPRIADIQNLHLAPDKTKPFLVF